MPSAIDPTKPQDVVPAVKADLRANLAAAKAELDHGGFAEGFTPSNYGSPASSQVRDHLAAIDAIIPSLGGGAGLTHWTDAKANHGAAGNGTTDDTTALQNALNSGAAVVYLPPGTYLLAGHLTVTPGTQLVGAGPRKTIIDGRGVSQSNSTGILHCVGSVTSLPSLSQSVTVSDGSISFSTSVEATLQHGDWIRLRDITTNSLNQQNTKDGFYAQVQSAEGSVVFLATPAVRTLPAARSAGPLSNVQAEKMDGRGVVLRDFALIGHAFDATSDGDAVNGLAIFLRNIANIHVENIEVLGGAASGIQLNSCAGGRIVHSRVTMHNGQWNAQGEYGIWVRDTGYVMILGCDLKANWNCTNFEGQQWPTHDVMVRDSFIGGPGTAIFSQPTSTVVNALSVHQGIFSISFIGCHVRGFVSLRGEEITIAQCLIEGVKLDDNGVDNGLIATSQLIRLNLRIIDNDLIVRTIQWKGSGCLFELSNGNLTQDPGVPGSLLFANNRIRIAVNTTQALFRLHDTSNKAPANGKIHILGNQVVQCECSTSQPWFDNNIVDMQELYVLDNIAPANMTLGADGSGFAAFKARNVFGGQIEYVGLSTSSPGGSGRLWSDGGTLRIT